MDAVANEPWIPDFSEDSPWRWEWWRVGLAPEDLFTTLEAKYNTVPYRIQGDEAFHHDVSDAAHEAKNLDDFHARLALRRDQRLQELRKAWDSIAVKIVCSPSKVFGGHLTRWVAFQQFTSNRSLDALVLFFHSLLPPPTPATPQLRDPQLPGSPPVEADHHTEPLLPDTAPVSPCSLQVNPPEAAPTALQPPTPPPPPSLSPLPRQTARPSSPPTPLTRHAGVAKRRQHGRSSRQPDSDVKQQPTRQRKGLVTKTRASRRLAGRAPEFGGP